MPDVRILALTVLAALAGGCDPAARSGPAPRAVTVEAAEDWRGAALPAHAAVTEEIPSLFRRLVVSRGRRPAADRHLLDPTPGLGHAAPAPGAYRCRIVRLPAPAERRGRRGPERPGFCFVGGEGERLSLTVEAPARRLGGYLWPSGDGRQLVFLGAGFAPPARTAPPYGDPPQASMAGLLQRVGDFRYRLIVRGNAAGTLDVWELVAAPGD